MTAGMVLLGFEVPTGLPVYLPLHHLAAFGMTQKSGKTTALEALIMREGLKAIAFITKRGEAGFTRYTQVTPYYKPRADWQFVEGLVNVALGEKVKFEPGMRYGIMEVCKERKDLKEIQEKARELARASKRDFMKSVYEKLAAYLELVITELEKWTFTDRLALAEGINVMDLAGMRLETQHIVIASTIEYVFANMDHVIVIIPEAWETIPQGKMTPVKWVAQQFIRKGASLGNYLWLDSQDIGGVDKTPLRQCDNWLMGRMKEAHEVERILKQLLGAKIPAVEIQTLGLGQFYAAIGNDVKKVYVLPVGVPESVGVEVAMGKRTAESVRDEFLKVKVMEGDEMYKEENERLKAEIRLVNGEVSKLRVQLQTDEGEVQAHVKSLEDTCYAYKQQLEQDKAILERRDNELKDFESFKRALAGILPPALPASMPTGNGVPSEVTLNQEIPQLTLKISRPVVDVDEKNWRGRLVALVSKGFFDEPKRLTPIRARLQQDYGEMPNAANISNVLVELLNMHLFERRQENGQWIYSAFAGAKDRIKIVEVES